MKLSRTIPVLPVTRIDRAVEFYADRLGFRATHTDQSFAVLLRDDAELHLWAADDDSWRTRGPDEHPIVSGAETFLAGTASCRVRVDDIESLFEEYSRAGVLYAEDTTITKQMWGERDFPVLDLHRNLLTFFEPIDR